MVLLLCVVKKAGPGPMGVRPVLPHRAPNFGGPKFWSSQHFTSPVRAMSLRACSLLPNPIHPTRVSHPPGGGVQRDIGLRWQRWAALGDGASQELNRSKFAFEMAETHDEDKQLGDEEEEEYVLLELDDCLYCDVQPNDPYGLSGLDTLNPTLVVGDGPKMIGEYEETVGTCYLFSESDAPPKPIPDETTPSRENKDKQAGGSKETPSKEVKHLASVQKIIKFRSINVDQQQHRAYNDKEF